MLRTLFAAVLFVFAAGCSSSRPTPEQLAAADYGAYPDDYLDIAKKWLIDTYGPPSTSGIANIRALPPTKNYQMGSVFDSTGVVYGYEIEVSFSMPVMSGRRTTTSTQIVRLLVRNGKVEHYIDQRQ